MGFPVEIETEAPEIIAPAADAWSRYSSLAADEPVRIRVTVSGESEACGDTPRVEFEGARMSIVRSARNHAQANLTTGAAELHLTRDVAADPGYVTYYFLKPLVYLLLAPRRFAFAHASCIALNGRAMTLCGDAAAGKTCLAYACARRGWAFLSGDATHLLHDSSDFEIAGRPYSIRFRESAKDLFPELGAWPSVMRPNGKVCMEIGTERLGLRTALRAPASHIVFLRRRGEGGARITSIQGDETLRRLEESVFFGDAVIRNRQRATLAHFASLPAVSLEYAALDGAEAALRELSLGGA
jgi:hypothetical protein